MFRRDLIFLIRRAVRDIEITGINMRRYLLINGMRAIHRDCRQCNENYAAGVLIRDDGHVFTLANDRNAQRLQCNGRSGISSASSSPKYR